MKVSKGVGLLEICYRNNYLNLSLQKSLKCLSLIFYDQVYNGISSGQLQPSYLYGSIHWKIFNYRLVSDLDAI